MRLIYKLIHVKRKENSRGAVYLIKCRGNNCQCLIHRFKNIFQLNFSKEGLTKSSSLTVLWNQCMDVNSKFYSNLRFESNSCNSCQWEEYYILHYYRNCHFQITTLLNLYISGEFTWCVQEWPLWRPLQTTLTQIEISTLNANIPLFLSQER